MFSRASRQRRVSIVALVALVASLVASPFAQAQMTRMSAVGADLCKSGAAQSSMPAAPAEHGHAAHGAACDCCVGTAPVFAPPLAAVRGSCCNDAATATVPPQHVVLATVHSPRGGQPRAPPILA